MSTLKESPPREEVAGRAAPGWRQLPGQFQRVVVATDGSENSLRAAAWAGQLLSASADVEVTLVHVAPPPLPSPAAAGEDLSRYLDVPVDVMVRRAAAPILERTRAALNLPGARVQTEVLVGRPADEIVNMARLTGCDLIICGRRGLTGLKELFLGSVSDRLIHQAPCPVLVVQ